MIYIFGAAFDPPHVGHSAIVRTLLYYKNPKKIILIPSGKRNDKSYNVSDEQRLMMLEMFVSEIGDERVITDDYFVKNWEGEMITRDVDIYAREKYGDNIIHVFGTDTITSMPEWDEEGYAAKKIKKLFVPRVSEYSPHGGELEGCVVPEIGTHPPNLPNIGRDGNSHPPNLPHGGRNETTEATSSPGLSFSGEGLEQIQNYEFFTDSHIPDISSTEIRKIIPEYTTLKHLFDENLKFIIKGLSNQISRYILEHRLYRPKLAQKPKILVHVCCGPDVTMPILQLRDEYDVICFWYDPNIQPKEEYDKRYEAFVRICEIEKIPYIKGAYDVKHFFRRIRGLEHTPEKGEKCTHCYDMRMYVAAKLAAKLRIPYYTSSLNTSPKKDLEKLFKIGKEYADRFHLEFLDIPFRKRGGFEKSVEYTREHDIYRQNYCGCIYSIREGGEGEMKKRMVG